MKLHCFEGEPPSQLAPALNALAAMPALVLAKLPSILADVVGPMPDDQLDARIIRLCRSVDADPERTAPPIKATRYLFRQAASAGTSVPELTADLRTLGVDATTVELLAKNYEAISPLLKEEIASASITAHGKVLAGIDWRLDAIAASSRGRNLQLPIALVTLHYQDRGTAGSFTVQLLPSMVKELRDACDALLGPHE